MSIPFGTSHPLLHVLDGEIYVIEREILNREQEYEFKDVVLAALRGMAPGKGSVKEIARLMERILSPETPDDEAFKIWADNATMYLFYDVEGLRMFARLVLDVIEANPDLRRDR